LLAERPSGDVTVLAIMDRTTLSRKSFYVYFRDRADLLAALVGPLRADADRLLARWRESTDAIGAGRAALHGAALAYRQHGAVLRALAVASEQDPEAAAVWRGFIEPVVEVGAQKIRAAAPTGLDPEATARALVTMNVHSLLTLRPDASGTEVDRLVETLSTIWERTIFRD
jgi:AcrR family transcriptional regulator